LDRTAFYPEGGGQLPDRGTLTIAGSTFDVTDVQVDDSGEIHHVLPAEPHDIVEGRTALGSIDIARRRDHMSQHTGQHMLSAALIDVAGAETVSARLGSESSTIDVASPSLDDALVAKAEDLVNDVVLADRNVTSLFPTPEELRRLPLRRPPKVEENVRLIDIDGFDLSPCGGTHCTRTGQVGFVRITGVERYKGGCRITFLAGRRTLDDARKKEAVLRELCRSFTCGPFDVPTAVGKLRAELRAKNDLFGTARGELVGLLSERLLAAHPKAENGPTRIAVMRNGEDLGGLRALASALARRPDVIAMAASKDEGSGDWLLVVERGADVSSFDAGKWLKAKAGELGGRGGGRSERAEGRLSGSASWETVTAAFEG
jgi:alanyl-tRNA synthetase